MHRRWTKRYVRVQALKSQLKILMNSTLLQYHEDQYSWHVFLAEERNFENLPHFQGSIQIPVVDNRKEKKKTQDRLSLYSRSTPRVACTGTHKHTRTKHIHQPHHTHRDVTHMMGPWAKHPTVSQSRSMRPVAEVKHFVPLTRFQALTLYKAYVKESKV